MKRKLPQNLTVDPTLMALFNDVAGQRTDGVVQINEPKRQFEATALQGALSEQKGSLDGLLTGTPLSVFYPFGSSNVLESFRTQNTSARIPQALPNREMSANFTTPVMRVVKPYTSTLDAISKYELAIEFKGGPGKMDSYMVPHVGRLEGEPMCIFNPSTFNHAQYTAQMRDAKRNYEEYCLKTPWEYWRHWGIGGIVESEEMLNGSESFTTSGFSGNSRSQAAGGYKFITISSKGPQFLYNYFGPNIKAGGKCYAIFKKHALPREYYLDNKPNIGALSGRHSVPRVPLIDDVPNDVRPFQLSFVCLPNGGKLPRAATMYRDERDILRRDGIAIYLGKIFSVPIDHVFKPITNFYDVDPVTKRITDSRGHPFTDAREGRDYEGIMYMKLIMDCDDGIGAL